MQGPLRAGTSWFLGNLWWVQCIFTIKIVGGEIINTPLVFSVVFQGLYFYMRGNDFCGYQYKVGIKLMCPFIEKLLKYKKVCDGGPKSDQKNCPVMPKGAQIERKPVL